MIEENEEMVMDKIQFVILLASMVGMFVTQRSDLNFYRSEASADRRELSLMCRELKDEMKDFHGRLCAIEERNKGK